jgi:small subunit ribosomal protein S16
VGHSTLVLLIVGVETMVTIRFSRGGRVHMPIYTIVATDSRNRRDGRFLEKLGQYNPHLAEGNLIGVEGDRIKELVAKGATMSSSVKTLLKKNKIQLA